MKQNISKQKEMRDLYESYSTEQLVRATTIDKNDYTSDALNLMQDELGRRGASPQDVAATEILVKQTVEQEKKQLLGIKGFLLLFVLLLAIQSVSAIIVSISALVNNVSLIKILLLPVGIYGLFVLYLLLSKKNNAPMHVRRWIGAIFVASILIIGLTILIGPDRIEGTFIANPIAALIWLAYFSYSKRVKATYSSALSKEN